MIQIENAFWSSLGILVGFLVGIFGSLFVTELNKYQDLYEKRNNSEIDMKKFKTTRNHLIIFSIGGVTIILIYLIIFLLSWKYLQDQYLSHTSQNVTIINNYYTLNNLTIVNNLSKESNLISILETGFNIKN